MMAEFGTVTISFFVVRKRVTKAVFSTTSPSMPLIFTKSPILNGRM